MGNTQHRSLPDMENPQEEECDICVETIFLPNKKFKNQNKCAHQFCLNCIIKYITVEINDHKSQIKCPALNCEHYLDPLFCRLMIPDQVFDKWCDLLCDSVVLQFDRCYCPNKDCSVVILNECGGRVEKSKCPKCKKWFCFSCKTVWHAGYRCGENGELRDENDFAFGVLADSKKWKRCPICHHYVERTTGCSTVRCRCRTRFCYNCGSMVDNNLSYSVCRCRTRFCYNCGSNVTLHRCHCPRQEPWYYPLLLFSFFCACIIPFAIAWGIDIS